MIDVQHLGVVDYDTAMAKMNALHAQRVAGQISDTILILEHPAVITRGRKMQDQPLMAEQQLTELGVQIRNADRGGELTYHGPGQIVVYFILHLQTYAKGIADFVKILELALIDFLQAQGVTARIEADHPGIWVGEKKLASLGLRVSAGITKHGIALNVRNDLSVYQWFAPCGLSGETMTNLEMCLGQKIASESYENLFTKLANTFVRFLVAPH